MKAIVYENYGSSAEMKLREVEKPTAKAGEVLVKVHGASINAADWHNMRGEPFILRMMGFGLFKPKYNILGADIAGVVEALGEGVSEFQVGAEVYGDLAGCGWGGFAEYVSASVDAITLKPSNLTFEEAGAVPLACNTALQGLRDTGCIKTGDKVLINGAGGGVGSFAVQIAKAIVAETGVVEVTGVCSTGKVDMVRDLGADLVIDYTKEDFTKGGKCYDLILDTAGHRSIGEFKSVLNPNGRYVFIGGSKFFQPMFLGPLMSNKSGKKFSFLMSEPNKENLEVIRELIEAGKVRPAIDKRYPLSEVPEAMKYFEEVHAKGKIIITFD